MLNLNRPATSLDCLIALAFLSCYFVILLMHVKLHKQNTSITASQTACARTVESLLPAARYYPSTDLEPEARPLGDHQESRDSASCRLLKLTPSAIIRWRA
jgi:hypothetical protein